MMGNALTALSITACLAGSATMAQANWPCRTIDATIGADPRDDIHLNARTMARQAEPDGSPCCPAIQDT